LREQLLEGRRLRRGLPLLGGRLERGPQLRLGDAELAGDAAEAAVVAAFAVPAVMTATLVAVAVRERSGRSSSAQECGAGEQDGCAPGNR
jgi:hypothetical protein